VGVKHGRRSASRFAPPELREQLAQEAARLMVEGGIEDFGLAKRKAAERLGVRGAGALPSNAQIEACRAERQRIFDPDHDQRLTDLRRLAAETMEWLDVFRPRLVGPVLAGTATINAVVELHVFSDEPERVAATLVDRRVLLRDCQRRYRFTRDAVEQIPGFSFVWRGEQVDVLVFSERGAHHAPLSPVDQKPMRRAGRNAVLALVD
jgi:hypothetical protein